MGKDTTANRFPPTLFLSLPSMAYAWKKRWVLYWTQKACKIQAVLEMGGKQDLELRTLPQECSASIPSPLNLGNINKSTSNARADQTYE